MRPVGREALLWGPGILGTRVEPLGCTDACCTHPLARMHAVSITNSRWVAQLTSWVHHNTHAARTAVLTSSNTSLDVATLALKKTFVSGASQLAK